MRQYLFAIATAALLTLAAPGVGQAQPANTGTTVIVNANIFDGKSDQLANGMSVLIEANKITKIGKVPAMEQKGRLQEGMDADITVFDPETIIDRATVDQPAQTSAGIKYVVVNGTLLIEDGVMKTDVLPGQPVRIADKQ